MNKPELNIRVETLETQLRRAAKCAHTTIPAEEFRAIVSLATRVKAYDFSGLSQVENTIDSEEVELTGKQLRLLLMLAIEARRRNLKSR